MKFINLPIQLTESDFQKLCHVWNKNKYIALLLPESLKTADAENLIEFLLLRTSNEFTFVALSSLAEVPNINPLLLERIFDRGDTACKVAICLRADLDDQLAEKCRNSPDPNVREHFLARISTKMKN